MHIAANTQTTAIYNSLDEVKVKSKKLRNASTTVIDQAISALQREKKVTMITPSYPNAEELKTRKLQVKTFDREIKQLKSLKKELRKLPVESKSDVDTFTQNLISRVNSSLAKNDVDVRNLQSEVDAVNNLKDDIGQTYEAITKQIQDVAQEHINWAKNEQPTLGKSPAKGSKRFSKIVGKLEVLHTKCQNATRKVLTQTTKSLDSLLRKEAEELKKAKTDREKTVFKNGKLASPVMRQISELINNLQSKEESIKGFIHSERNEIQKLKGQLRVNDVSQARVIAEREQRLNRVEAYLDLVISDDFLEPPRFDNDNQVQAWIKQRQGVLDQANQILGIMSISI